jgi:hypothetical protein
MSNIKRILITDTVKDCGEYDEVYRNLASYCFFEAGELQECHIVHVLDEYEDGFEPDFTQVIPTDEHWLIIEEIENVAA